MCWRISDMGLCKMDKFTTYTLGDFKTAQIDRLQEVAPTVRCF